MAESGATLKGLNTVIGNLNKEVKKIKNRSMKGLIQASIIVRRDMEYTPPLIPVDTGNLRDSWFTKPIFIMANPALVIGFSAFYAVFVHENLEAHFQRPGAGAKFMEASLKRNSKNILNAIAHEARIR